MCISYPLQIQKQKRLTSSTLNYTKSSQYICRYLHATYIIIASSVDPKTNSEFSCLKLLLLGRQMTLYCDFLCFMVNLLRCALTHLRMCSHKLITIKKHFLWKKQAANRGLIVWMTESRVTHFCLTLQLYLEVYPIDQERISVICMHHVNCMTHAITYLNYSCSYYDRDYISL